MPGERRTRHERSVRYGPQVDSWTGEEIDEGQVADAIQQSGHGFVFSEEHPFGRTRLERRISQRLHRVRWAFEQAEAYFTPAELQALALTYGAGVPIAECARRLGTTRQQFRDRVKRAERRVDDLYDAEELPRYRVKKGRPNARIDAPEGAEQLERLAAERLPMGAAHVWGRTESPRVQRFRRELNYLMPLIERQRQIEAIAETVIPVTEISPSH
jgi:predicted DNA-binding protein (UPF0251 family)